MENKFTKLKSLMLHVKSASLLVVMFLAFNAKAQNTTKFLPWCQGLNYHANASATYWYSAIEQVTVQQGDGILFNKAPDGLQPDPNGTNNISWNLGHVLNNANNPLELVAGATYTIKVSLSSTVGYATTFWSAWIDYDNNKTFETGERLHNNGISATHPTTGGTPGTQTEVTFTIPCQVQQGLTRLRLINGIVATYVITAQQACNDNITFYNYRYGETEDLFVFISQPTLLAADFIVPQTLWAGAPSIIYNSNPRQATYRWGKGNGVDYIGNDYLTVFPTGGAYDVTLIAENCLGTTSVTKKVNIRDIPQRPEADFVASRNVITDGDEVTFFDLTQYGPFKWDWDITSFTDQAFLMNNSNIRGGKSFGNSFFHPVFRFNAVGEFNVSLTATNLLGSNKRNKANYITVEPFSDFLLGVGATQTELGSGRILDAGGLDKNYPSGSVEGNPNRNRLLIKPCGAEEITLTIEKLMLGNVNHRLMVWDGEDTMGVALHPDQGFSTENTVVPRSIVAKSGSMFIMFDARALGTSEGLIARWSTKFGSTNAPAPFFEQEFPTQAYSKAEVFFAGSVKNLFGLNTVKWKVDGFEVAPALVKGDKMTYTFPEAGAYQVCLEVKSCAGDSSFCRTINVVDPVGRTSLDFFASDDRPELGQNVVLNGVTDKANRFQWQIVPATYSINSGNLLSKYPNVSFNEPGAYSISLRAWNTFDSASSTRFLVKNNYVIVIDPCIPLAFESSEDVTNNRLTVKDKFNQVVFNHTSSGGQAYRSFLLAGDPVVNLTFGSQYTIEMFRQTTADTVSRAIYIDYNSNGQFEANELVLNEVKTRNQTASATFTVPPITAAYNGTTRMRTIVAYGTTSHLDACGPGVLAEYKDYRVSLNKNGVPPTISLNGLDTVDLEVGSSYTDAGATAFDVVDGDVSNLLTSQTNLDVNQPGIYFVRYDVVNSSGVGAIPRFRQIFVSADRTAPIITLNGSLIDTFEVNSGVYVDPMGIAIDNIDGDISSEIVVTGSVDATEIGTYTLLYSVKDVQGNIGTATRVVHVVDRTAPEFVFTTGEKLQLGTFWFDQTTVKDNYWAAKHIDFRIEPGMNGPVRWDVAGQYPVTYRATDGSGNINVVNRVYEVGDFIAPTVILNTADRVTHRVKETYRRVDPIIFDNYYGNNQLTITFTSNVNPDVLGVYEDRYVVEDPSGNTTTAVRTVEVVDVIAPSIAAASFCTKLGVDFNPMTGVIISDNYYTQSELLPLVEVVSSNVNVWFEGTYTMVYQVTDPSGNKSNLFTRDFQVSDLCEVITSVDLVNTNAGFIVYPNPSAGIFNISLQNVDAKRFEVVNNLGAVVYVIDNIDSKTNLSLDLSAFSSGIYHVKAITADATLMQRIVILNK